MLQLATLHRGAKPAFTIFYRAGAKELENAIHSPQVFLLRKKDVERASMTGESSRACFSWLRFIAERNLPSQSSTELEHFERARERDLFSTGLSSSKERR